MLELSPTHRPRHRHDRTPAIRSRSANAGANPAVSPSGSRTVRPARANSTDGIRADGDWTRYVSVCPDASGADRCTPTSCPPTGGRSAVQRRGEHHAGWSSTTHTSTSEVTAARTSGPGWRFRATATIRGTAGRRNALPLATSLRCQAEVRRHLAG